MKESPALPRLTLNTITNLNRVFMVGGVLILAGLSQGTAPGKGYQ